MLHTRMMDIILQLPTNVELQDLGNFVTSVFSSLCKGLFSILKQTPGHSKQLETLLGTFQKVSKNHEAISSRGSVNPKYVTQLSFLQPCDLFFPICDSWFQPQVS